MTLDEARRHLAVLVGYQCDGTLSSRDDQGGWAVTADFYAPNDAEEDALVEALHGLRGALAVILGDCEEGNPGD